MSHTSYEIVEVTALLYKAGDKLSVHDEPDLALAVSPEDGPFSRVTFDEWEDMVGERAEGRRSKRSRAFLHGVDTETMNELEIPEGPTYDFYPVLRDFWALHLTHVGEMVGSAGAMTSIEFELDAVGWGDVVDAVAIRRDIDALTTACEERWKKPFGEELGEPAEEVTPIVRVQFMALIELSYWKSNTEYGEEHDSSCNYLGRLDPKKLKLALVTPPASPASGAAASPGLAP